MHVTIITDASFCHESKASGYGVWVASHRGKKEFGGPLRDLPGSGEAEYVGIARGLYHALESKLALPGDTILIQNDLQPAINFLNGGRGEGVDKKYEVKAWIDAIAKKYNLSISYKHIKGHTSQKDRRYKSQNKCDRRAYAEMQKERKIFYARPTKGALVARAKVSLAKKQLSDSVVSSNEKAVQRKEQARNHRKAESASYLKRMHKLFQRFSHLANDG